MDGIRGRYVCVALLLFAIPGFATPSSAQFVVPDVTAFEFGPDGNVYLISEFQNEVWRYDGATGSFIDVFIAAGSGGLSGGRDLTFGPDGNLYVSSGGDKVLRYDGGSGAFLGVFVEPGSGLHNPIGLVFGPDLNLYVASEASNEILRFDGQTGAFIDVFMASGAGGIAGGGFFVWGPDGNVYVAGAFSDSVVRLDGQTGAFIDVFVPAGSGGLRDCQQLRFGPDGNLYVINGFDHGVLGNAVLGYDGVTGAFIGPLVTPLDGRLYGPYALDFRAGDLYVSSTGTDEILRYDGLTGVFLDVFVPGVAGVGGTVAGLAPDKVRCADRSTAVMLDLFLPPGETTWDCERGGLSVNADDKVLTGAVGIASSSGISGFVTGFSPVKIRCDNLSTGQRISVPVSPIETAWDCKSEGLVVTPGNTILTGAIGINSRKIIFVSSQSWTGDTVGGVAGGDAKCNSLAQASGLPGTYKAWLSDDTTGPAVTMTHSPYPYVLSDGRTRVAEDWNDLTDKNLIHIINLDENRQRPASDIAWTGTTARGIPFPGLTCGGWTTTGSGLVGQWSPPVGTSVCWSKCGSLNCNQPASIYCVQQ